MTLWYFSDDFWPVVIWIFEALARMSVYMSVVRSYLDELSLRVVINISNLGIKLNLDIRLALESISQRNRQRLHARLAKIQQRTPRLLRKLPDLRILAHGLHKRLLRDGHVPDVGPQSWQIMHPVETVEDAPRTEGVDVAAVDAVDHGRGQVLGHGFATRDVVDPVGDGKVLDGHSVLSAEEPSHHVSEPCP